MLASIISLIQLVGSDLWTSPSWILFIGSVAAGLLDHSLFWRKSPILSTILFTILATGIVIIARASSAIYSLLKTSFYTWLIGSSIVNEATFFMAIKMEERFYGVA